MNMERISPFCFRMILLLPVTGMMLACSLEANIQELAEEAKVLPTPMIRHDKDFQQAEVAKSGHYEVHGQVGEIAEKKSSGQYVIEGVIAYE